MDLSLLKEYLFARKLWPSEYGYFCFCDMNLLVRILWRWSGLASVQKYYFIHASTLGGHVGICCFFFRSFVFFSLNRLRIRDFPVLLPSREACDIFSRAPFKGHLFVIWLPRLGSFQCRLLQFVVVFFFRCCHQSIRHRELSWFCCLFCFLLAKGLIVFFCVVQKR